MKHSAQHGPYGITVQRNCNQESMTHPFEHQLLRNWTEGDWSNVTVLLAVSGGADSIALLRAACRTRVGGLGRLVAIHYNHHLRGSESDADESFVRDQCLQLGVPCAVAHASNEYSRSSEESARHDRYDCFVRAAQSWGARYVATAHTSDDQAETILHRILRGTGLKGLAGIPRVRELLPGVSLIRPLLESTRSQVVDYLEAIGQPFRQDSSNTQARFTRNRLRNDLIPWLEREYNPQVKEALLRLGQLAGEAHDVLVDATGDLWRRAVHSASSRNAVLDCAELAPVPTHLVRQLLISVWQECGWGLQGMTFEHWNQLANLVGLADPLPGRMMLPGGVQAERDKHLLRLSQSAEP